jgi:serine/threonine protein phosphatase 1
MAGDDPILTLFAPTVPEGRRVYAIGDVHGRMDLLDQLIRLIGADDARRPPMQTEIILLGDLIDRGPDSAAVVARAMTGSVGFAPLVTLMGNHEEQMVDSVAGDGEMISAWLFYGGKDTLRSFGVPEEIIASDDEGLMMRAARAVVPSDVIRWLRALPISLRIGDYLFVHAGIRPGVPLDAQDPVDMRWIRRDFLDSEADHGAVIVHGHSIQPDVQLCHNRIGIDTGAYASGKLTAIGLEGTDRWILET